jgi:hypothetical protein
VHGETQGQDLVEPRSEPGNLESVQTTGGLAAGRQLPHNVGGLGGNALAFGLQRLQEPRLAILIREAHQLVNRGQGVLERFLHIAGVRVLATLPAVYLLALTLRQLRLQGLPETVPGSAAATQHLAAEELQRVL